MKTILIAAGALVVGIALGIVYCEATIRHLRKRLKELRAGKPPPSILRSVTRFLFVTTQVFALVWVTWSYVIATYSTVVLEQPFPVETLSDRAFSSTTRVWCSDRASLRMIRPMRAGKKEESDK